jgi:hypothetical protein
VMPTTTGADASTPHFIECTCMRPDSGVICFYTGKEDGPAYEN